MINEWREYKQVKLWSEEPNDIEEESSLIDNSSNKVSILF
jgi:hypothetical protein